MILQDDFKQQILPLARIKKIMKLDEPENVLPFMTNI
jgi:hypothetical protein